MSPTLLILAAGMGSRYGGLKQMESMGPGGETLLDYSVFDAKRAGFGRVVFVIRREFSEQFHESVGKRFASHLPVSTVYQEPSDLPAGFALPSDRQKPWGTGHAIWSAREAIRENFCVINADDFYGREAYASLSHWLQQPPTGEGILSGAMVGYRLGNTLTRHGSVSRGLCTCDSQGLLVNVEEKTSIFSTPTGAENRPPDLPPESLSLESKVSLNFWGFTPEIFPELGGLFSEFLTENRLKPKSEFYIPFAVDALIKSGRARIQVLPTPSPWFGVTYREDKQLVQERLAELIQSGQYPDPLWG